MKRLILPEFFLAWFSNLNANGFVLLILAILLTACSNLPTSSFFESKEPPKKSSSVIQRGLNKPIKQPTNIAILLPERGPFAASATSIRAGILYAKQQDHNGNRVAIHFYDTESAPLATTYDRAVKEGAEFVIGPLTKDHVTQLVR